MESCRRGLQRDADSAVRPEAKDYVVALRHTGARDVNVLVACEFSGIVREAFRRRGHDAWSCDLRNNEDESDFHIIGDALEITRHLPWDLMIAHPPCTYL